MISQREWNLESLLSAFVSFGERVATVWSEACLTAGAVKLSMYQGTAYMQQASNQQSTQTEKQKHPSNFRCYLCAPFSVSNDFEQTKIVFNIHLKKKIVHWSSETIFVHTIKNNIFLQLLINFLYHGTFLLLTIIIIAIQFHTANEAAKNSNYVIYRKQCYTSRTGC